MGEVHEAIDQQSGARVAIKLLIMNAESPEKEDEVVARFEREARSAAQVLSPHVVRVFDAGRDPESKQPYMVMEYLVGEDVQRASRRAPQMPVHLALKIAAQACLGLEAAHAAGVVHRDIKPANLFLSQDPTDADKLTVKVVDFGIARMSGGGVDLTQDLTRTGSMLGSPAYMSPEQVRGVKTVDGRADVWSLGVVLYKLLCGATPHAAKEAGLGEMLIAICCANAPPIQRRAPWVPPEVAHIVHKALKIDINKRYRSAREMYDALAVVLNGNTAIRGYQITPLTELEKQIVAPTAEISGGMTNPDMLDDVDVKTMLNDELATRATAGLSITAHGAPPRSSSKGPMLVASLGVLALAGVGGILYAKRPPAVAPAAAIVVQASAEPVKMQGVAVQVPAGCEVKLDGKVVAVSPDGKLPFEAPPNSAHSIALTRDGETKYFQITVTPSGAEPPTLDWPKAVAPTTPKPTSRPTAGGGPATAAPVKPKPTGGIVTDFDK